MTAAALSNADARMHAVLQDQVQFAFIDLVTAIPRITGGGLRPLAVSSTQRAAVSPMATAMK